jgi:hypothetical protein
LTVTTDFTEKSRILQAKLKKISVKRRQTNNLHNLLI